MPKRMSRRSSNARPTKRARRMGGKSSRRVPRAISSNQHNFKRMLGGNFTTWSTGATNSVCSQIAGNALHAPWLGAFQLNGISNVVNSADFTGLYDQYRINYLELKFYMKIDPSVQTGTGGNIPRLYFYRDYDDSLAPGTLDDMRENTKTKVYVLDPYKPVTIKIKPNVLAAMYQSAVSTQYSPVFNKWLDAGSPSTPHYVGKFAIDDLRTTNYFVQVEGTLYFSCRQPR